jgi:hypothetical protein
MKNLHLVPPSVTDIVEKLVSPIAHENEKMNYILRLEAIRDYCIDIINKNNNTSPVTKFNMRKKI